ncbi:radical SAM/SPASM domain-containing protein [Planctomycetota bacterium]
MKNMTVPLKKKVYSKKNSVVELDIGADVVGEAKDILKRIVKLRSNKRVLSMLSAYEQEILGRVFCDLFGTIDSSSSSRYQISNYAIGEILSYVHAEETLAKYLFNRYRYEMFPQQYILDDYPPYLQIEPTSHCNYKCVFCVHSDKAFTAPVNGHMGHMSVDLFKAIIDQAEGHVEFLCFSDRGEPLLCKNIEEMLAYTQSKFMNLKLNTNASLLDEAKCHSILCSGVKTLVFSVDAADERLYSQYRVNGDFNKVCANIGRFQEIRRKYYPDSEIVTRVSGVKYGEEQDMKTMTEFWGKMVDQVSFVAYRPREHVYNQASNHLETPCSDLWRRMFVWWDGSVNPCDVDYKSTLCVGNVNEKSIKDIWTSEKYLSLRNRHVTNKRQTLLPCKQCDVV